MKATISPYKYKCINHRRCNRFVKESNSLCDNCLEYKYGLELEHPNELDETLGCYDSYNVLRIIRKLEAKIKKQA